MPFESKFEVERAWTGGPLRKVGSGNGTPSRFVCEMCKRSSVGVYLVKPDVQRPESALWTCLGCSKTAKSTPKAKKEAKNV